MGYVFKFAYDGTEFSGYQKGNGQNSVEDTIINRLKAAGINNRIMSAARTDRGVSAIGNAVYIDSDEKPDKIAGVVNSGGQNLIFHSYAIVGKTFRPRHCDMKLYRYILSSENLLVEKISTILHRFEGTHDFSFFSKLDGRNPVRTINRIDVTQSEHSIYVDFYGQSFLWNQIRCIIAYSLRNYESNAEADPFDIRAKFSGIAEAYPLVLMDIFYFNLKFTSIPLIRYRKKIKADMDRTAARLEREKFLLDRVAGKEFSFNNTFNLSEDDSA